MPKAFLNGIFREKEPRAIPDGGELVKSLLPSDSGETAIINHDRDGFPGADLDSATQ